MALDLRAGIEGARTTAYVRRFGYREPDILKKCRLETLRTRADASIMTAPEVAGFVAFFLAALGAKHGLEIGVFTGYSSLAFGLALPKDGSLTVCEIDPVNAATAKGYWDEAGLSDRIRCLVGDARASLQALLDEGSADRFDFAYIDADKEGYDSYFEASLKLVRRGGVIIIDNTLWGGRVADRNDDADATVAIRALNAKLHADERIDLIQTTMGDGTTFARRR